MTGPTVPTIKRLFAVSGNQCAYPKCDQILVHENGTVTGHICHIKGRRGARHDPHQPEEQLHSFDNLMLLCRDHHAVIDSDETTYRVEVLCGMKADHERSHVGGSEPSTAVAEQLISLMDTLGVRNSLLPANLRLWADGVLAQIGRAADAELPVAVDRIRLILTQCLRHEEEEQRSTEEAWTDFRGTVNDAESSGRDVDGFGNLLGSVMGVELTANRRNRAEKIRRIERAMLEIHLHDEHTLWKSPAELLTMTSEVLLGEPQEKSSPTRQVQSPENAFTDGDWIAAGICGPEKAESLMKRMASSFRKPPEGTSQDAITLVEGRGREEIAALRKRFDRIRVASHSTDDERCEACIAKIAADILERELDNFLWEATERPDDDVFQVFREVTKQFAQSEKSKWHRASDADS